MRARGYIVLFTLALIWGASFLFIKNAVDEVSPATVVTGRLAFSVVTLLAIVAFQPKLMRGWWRYWWLAILVGVVNIIIPFTLISWGETSIASGTASILNATTPLFTVLLASVWIGMGHERLTVRKVAGVLLGFLGVGVLVGPSALDFSGNGGAGLWGELAVLVAALSYGVGGLLSRRYGGSATLVGPLTAQVAALLISAPIALWWDPPTRLPSVTAIGSIALLGVFGTGIAYLLYFWLIRNVGATRTSLVTYLLPCTALIWGALFRSEPVYWNALAGLALVLLGTIITNGALNGLFRRRAAPATTEAPASDAPVVDASVAPIIEVVDSQSAPSR